MRRKSDLLKLLALGLQLNFCTVGWQVASAVDETEAVRRAIVAYDPQVAVRNLRPSAVKGLYEASIGGTSGFITTDGRYFMPGDMLDLQTRKNLSEENRKIARASLLKAADMSESVEFIPPNAKYTVIVFTDVDCAYCRKLHSEISKYNEAGIGLKYVAFPRSGPGSESWRKMEAVWCSADRKEAITRAKKGESIQKAEHCTAPAIAQHYALGQQLSVSGTPMMFLEDGSVVGGYLSPAQLVAQLQRLTRSNLSAGN